MQQRTSRLVGFEITQMNRDWLLACIKHADLDRSDQLFPTRADESPHLSTRQSARIV